MNKERLLRLDVRCPHCHATPRFRLREGEREKYASDPPDREIGTFQCHKCNRTYPVTARAVHEAA